MTALAFKPVATLDEADAVLDRGKAALKKASMLSAAADEDGLPASSKVALIARAEAHARSGLADLAAARQMMEALA